MSKRDRKQIPMHASIMHSSKAAPLGDVGYGDTVSILNREGTQSKHSEKRIISNRRVPVVAPDGTPLMPTKPSRARRWIREGKAKPIRTKIGIFVVQLLEEPSDRKKQSIAATLDPGSKFSGVAVVSKKNVLCGFNLELPDYIKDRMDKRRMLRRGRRHRKTRSRECRFLNRIQHKIAPSILVRKQFELRVMQEMAKLYPISIIGIENVAYKHGKGTKKESYFSQVEVGKQWLIAKLEEIAPTKLFAGWQTSKRRKELGLEKSSDKTKQTPESHVNDAISLGALLLGDVELTDFHFDIIRRPKYSRRRLHAEKPTKGGIRRRYGGTTTPFIFRCGDYVEATQGRKTVRGWVSGYTKNLISISNFNWKRLGQFTESKVRLLDRNSRLLLKSQFLHRINPVVSLGDVL